MPDAIVRSITSAGDRHAFLQANVHIMFRALAIEVNYGA